MVILETVVPVFLFIAIGKFLKAKDIITDESISFIKFICLNIFLPVMIFDSLAHSEFTSDSFVLIGLMVFCLFFAFACGFFFKRFFDKDVCDYVPYAMPTYEGGLFGIALITILVGQRNIAQILSMDVISGVFVFTVMATGLKLISGQKMTKKEVAASICTNPVLISVALGFVAAATGFGSVIDSSAFANLYTKTTNFFIQPISPLILICIGSGLVFERQVLAKGLKLALLRLFVQGTLCATTLVVLSLTGIINPVLKISVLVYFFVPTSFLLSMYTRDQKSIEFVSGYLSLQILISLTIFSVVSVYAGYIL